MNIIVLDTETANGSVNGELSPKDSMVYDCGWCVMEENGEVIVERSFVNKDIFCNEPQMMNECFFKDKIPQYEEEIAKGERLLRAFYEIRHTLFEDCIKYDVKAISAHNAYFDMSALNATQRWLTKSKYRFFYPFGIELWDTLKMARQILAKDENYLEFCKKFDYFTPKTKKVKLTAEIIYRYITKDNEFIEKHTGLEDVRIEREILTYLLERNAEIEKALFQKK